MGIVICGIRTTKIVKLNIIGNIFVGDAKNCFDASINESENILMAKRYWENLPNMQNEAPIIEILADGDIEVLEIVKQIHANIGNVINK